MRSERYTPEQIAYVNAEIDCVQNVIPDFLIQARQIFFAGFCNPDLQVTEKSVGDYVTQADKQIERRFREWVYDRFTRHAVFGEEQGYADTVERREFTWKVDPIDGTTMYKDGSFDSSIVLGLCYEDEPVFALCDLPNYDLTYIARMGRGVTANGERITPTSFRDLQQVDAVICTLEGADRQELMIGKLQNRVKRIYTRNSSLIEVCDVISGKAGVGVWYNLGEHEWPTAWLFAKESGSIIRELDNLNAPFKLKNGGTRSFLIAGNADLFHQAKNLVNLPSER